MAHYCVRAHLKPTQAAELLEELTTGRIRQLKPEGTEIHRALSQARVHGDGTVEWGEMCFCATPLDHERQTVLDRFFDGLTTREVEGPHEPMGARPLPDVLAELAGRAR